MSEKLSEIWVGCLIITLRLQSDVYGRSLPWLRPPNSYVYFMTPLSSSFLHNCWVLFSRPFGSIIILQFCRYYGTFAPKPEKHVALNTPTTGKTKYTEDDYISCKYSGAKQRSTAATSSWNHIFQAGGIECSLHGGDCDIFTICNIYREWLSRITYLLRFSNRLLDFIFLECYRLCWFMELTGLLIPLCLEKEVDWISF